MTNNTLPPSHEWDYNDRNGELTFTTEGGYTVRLVPDDCEEYPREWDNLGTLFLHPRAPTSGDKGALDPRDLDPKEIAVLLPVYILDHSGVRVSVHDFGDPWDSCCAGAIYLTRADVIKEYGWKVITKARKAKLESYLKGEIQTLNDYLSGDVVGLIVTDRDGEELDNCWGFYPDHDPIERNVGMAIIRGRGDRWALVIAEAQMAIDLHVKDTTINPVFAGVGL